MIFLEVIIRDISKISFECDDGNNASILEGSKTVHWACHLWIPPRQVGLTGIDFLHSQTDQDIPQEHY